MLQILFILLIGSPLAYRVLLALFDPKRLHEQESVQVLHMIETKMGVPTHDPILDEIGHELMKIQGIEATFLLVPSDLVNAVALPNGTILVWQGLLGRIRRDKDKVAAILAHELAHLYHDHHLRRLYWMVMMQFALGFLSKGIVGSIFRQISFRTLFSSYSRYHERQADDTALDIILQSKFNPYKMIQVFSDFERLETQHYNFFSTHPSPTQRKLRILKRLQTEKNNNIETNISMNSVPTTTSTKDKEERLEDKEHVEENPTSKSPTSKHPTMEQELPSNVIPFPRYHRSKT